MMTAKEGLELVEQLLKSQRLTEIQKLIFRRSWEDKAYKDIAKETGHTSEYVKNMGSELWKTLSEVLEEKVTKHNFSTILQRYRHKQHHSVSVAVSQHGTVSHDSVSCYQDWGEAIDVSIFYGRTHELNRLHQWIVHDRCRLVTLLGMGGMGKTSLSVKLAEEIQGEFEYLIWRSLRDAPPIDELLTTLIQVLSRQKDAELPGSTSNKLSRLIELLKQSRCLIVLDNFETMLQSGKRAGIYGVAEWRYESGRNRNIPEYEIVK